MGQWGFKSYENDEAADAVDDGFEAVHGDTYNSLMDDSNPVGYDQVQKQLASPATLASALEALHATIGVEVPHDDWDDTERLAYVGVVVRHAEFGIEPPPDVRDRAIAWLEGEEIDWEDATLRKLRRQKELMLLRSSGPGPQES